MHCTTSTCKWLNENMQRDVLFGIVIFIVDEIIENEALQLFKFDIECSKCQKLL